MVNWDFLEWSASAMRPNWKLCFYINIVVIVNISDGSDGGCDLVMVVVVIW